MKKNIVSKPYYIILATVFLTFSFFITPSFAATLKYGDDVSVSASDSIDDDAYIAGENVLINGNIAGDVSAISGSIFHDGNVEEDVLMLAGNTVLSGIVGDDARIFAGTAFASGVVGGDIFIVGIEAYLSPDSEILGDAVIFAPRIVAEGTVAGGLSVYGKDVRVSGTVSGDLFSSAERLVISSEAVVEGNILYRGAEPIIEEGATVSGDLVREGALADNNSTKVATIMFVAIWKIATYLLLAILAMYFLSRSSVVAMEGMAKRFGFNAFAGLVAMIAIPVAIFLLSITLVAIPLAVLMLLAYVAIFILSFALGAIFLGSWVYKAVFKGSGEYQISWQSALLGSILFVALDFLPIVGWLIKLLLVLSAFGVISIRAFKALTPSGKGWNPFK